MPICSHEGSKIDEKRKKSFGKRDTVQFILIGDLKVWKNMPLPYTDQTETVQQLQQNSFWQLTV